VHAWTICVENTRDLDRKTMLPMIIEEESLRAALPLVIAGAWTDWIDISPIILGLRVYGGIAIDLACRGLKDATFKPFGKSKHIDRTVHRRLGGLHGIMLVMDGRGRTSEIVDLVDLDIDRERYVMSHQFETGVSMQMLNISLGTRKEIVHAKDVMPVRQKSIDQMRAQKSGAAGDENSFAAII